MQDSHLPKHHLQQIRLWSSVSWFLSAFLIFVASYLPLFDSSPELLVEHGSWALPLLRWDVFHFAYSGYVYEHQWAFFPGSPFLMKTIAKCLQFIGIMDATSWSAFLAAGTLACCFISSSTTLYDLTLHHTHSPTAAYLSALLSLIPTSPVTLRFVAYSEPFFTYLSYTGMLYCARSQWLWAACSFTLAGTFRSNGFMLSGFIIWGLLVEPTLNRKQVSFSHIAKCLLYTTATFVPFISHQYAAYTAFCTSVDSPAPWCSHFPPFIYTYVQVKYWNVGFLKYWTPGQIPNFLMCAPILVLLLWFTTTHIQKSTIPRLLLFLTSSSATSQVNPPSSSTFLSSSIAPHAIHALLLTLIYIFASHTQIILRQAAAMPTTYWAAAYLLMENPTLGRWWVGWSVVWGAVSIVLWTTFLPPA